MYVILGYLLFSIITFLLTKFITHFSLFLSTSGRQRSSSSQAPCCPVCGTSIRPGEMESHFAWEMERFCEENRLVSGLQIMLFLTITKEQKCGKEFQLKIASCVLRPSRLTLGKRKRRIPYLSRVARPVGGYLGFHIMKQDRGTPSQS